MRRPGAAAAVLLPVVAALLLLPGRAEAQASRQAFVFLVDQVSPAELLENPVMRSIAASGGLALMTGGPELHDLLSGGEQRGIGRRTQNVRYHPHRPGTPSFQARVIGEISTAPVIDLGSVDRPLGRRSVSALEAAGDAVFDEITESGAQEVLVIVATPSPSLAMIEARATVTPLILGVGSPSELLAEPPATTEGLRAVASDTTRRAGVASPLDIAPTVLDYLERPLPDEGSPLRVAENGSPLELYERHLAARRMAVPVGVAASLWVTFAGVVAILVLAFRRRLPRWLARIASWLPLTVAPLAVAMLAAGRLGTLTYDSVVPLLVVVPIVSVGLALLLRRFGALVPAAALGAAAILYLVFEAATGWEGTLTTLLGGTALEGARFYGLPNVFIGLLLGGALYVAVILLPGPGVVLLVLAALFAGLPWFGANLGGAITLLVAAGLWYAVERSDRHRFGFRETVVALGAGAAGVLLVLVANLVAANPTHVLTAVQGTGPLGLVGRFVERLEIGVALIRTNPFALVPVVGTLVVLLVLRRPPRVLLASFDRHPAWRRGMLVALLASAAAIVVNDTGPAAAGLGFGLALGGLLHVPLADRAGKMEA